MEDRTFYSVIIELQDNFLLLLRYNKVSAGFVGFFFPAVFNGNGFEG